MKFSGRATARLPTSRSSILSDGFYVICYDISADRRRLRVADELENYGLRVQRSVFECHLREDEFAELKRVLAELIDATEDHVRYYRLCPKDKPGIVVDGQGRVSVDADYHVV